MIHWAALVLPLFLTLPARSQTYSTTYLPGSLPDQSEPGQAGTNRCGTGFNQTSGCQNAYINSVDDFCVWGPPEPGPGSVVGAIERIAVAYCMKIGYGTRLIPDGTIRGAHFVQTPDFVQITGVGDFTKINIPAGDGGGEFDPHGADGNGNPVGGLVFSSAFGPLQQIHEWTNFMGFDQFCFRACKPGPLAPTYCEHIYDIMGCAWNMPASYAAGTFERCVGDSGEPMGIYGSSTFFQGDPATPPPHPAPSSSSCTTVSTIGNGLTISGTDIVSGPTSSVVPASATALRTQQTAVASGTPKPSASSTSSGVATHRLVGWTVLVGCIAMSTINLL